MALSVIKGKASAKPAPKPIHKESDDTPGKSGQPAWFTRGAASNQALDQAEIEIKAQIEQKQKAWRFYLPEEEEARITFVDGELDDDGLLKFFSFWEHVVKMGANFNNFVCTKEVEPCPLCEEKNLFAYFCGAFSIIDHREFKGKKGVYKNQKRLFVAKKNTLRYLQKVAAKHGGLAGCTFDVLRTGDNSANVGSHFEFVEKTDIVTLKKTFWKEVEVDGTKKKVTYFKPYDYPTEIVFRDAATLRKLLRLGGGPIGDEAGIGDEVIDDEDEVAEQPGKGKGAKGAKAKAQQTDDDDVDIGEIADEV